MLGRKTASATSRDGEPACLSGPAAAAKEKYLASHDDHRVIDPLSLGAVIPSGGTAPHFL